MTDIRKKTYDYDRSLEQLQQIRASGRRPSILLHGCCAPCSAFPLEWLSPYMDITIYYNNSNIYPQAEYEIRRDELLRYVEDFNRTQHTAVQVIVPEYDYAAYRKHLEPLKDEPECGKRCHLCYRLRMEEAYRFAEEHHFDWFCTVMTISRQKNSRVLNAIGEQLEAKYPRTRYFYSDFKKKGGIDRRNELVKQHNLYRQQYCGCEFSIRKPDQKR